jgi:leucyl/phenylalanyl-tRNA---protein transferase
VIAVGGKITPQNIIESYELGIFPWPHEGYPLLWFCPEERGIIDFEDLYIGRTLKKWIKKNEKNIQVKINTQLSEVIKNCRLQKRKGQSGSWINTAVQKTYTDLGKTGNVISIECFQGEVLVAGIYGVQSKKYFSCESMFHKIDNGSKYAFLMLVDYLQKKGFTWMDLQMVTEVCESFGAKYISKSNFLKRIRS